MQQIEIVTRYVGADMGLTVFRLNQRRLSEDFRLKLSESLKDHGVLIAPAYHPTNIQIIVDFPVLPDKKIVAAGAVHFADHDRKEVAQTLGDEIVKWARQASSAYKDIEARFNPAIGYPIRIVPFFVDSLDAHVLCARLGILADRLAPVLAGHYREIAHPPIALGFPRKGASSSQ